MTPVQSRSQAWSNPYQAPQTRLTTALSTADNNSGGGSSIQPPAGVKGWSWGAFLLNWVWAIFNKSWLGLLALVPYVGLVVAIYLGFKGRELAWRNKRWESLEHFDRVQRNWSRWAVIFIVGAMVLGIIAGIAIPAYQDYAIRARGH
jgi:hypothetical protein